MYLGDLILYACTYNTHAHAHRSVIVYVVSADYISTLYI
jgi:hypothetical protein